MWHNHLFSQRNKATKRAVWWKLDAKGVGENLKKGVGNTGGGYS